ncbi:hypothetical protein N7522_001659 [Penicillium canescens]|nr:hypothetical protein N7522_001659 [Penicillium canescens]
MPSNAHEIVFRTSIAACNSGDHLRVYMQDVQGKIRETVYENGWSNGTEKNVIASAKLLSPLACTSKELEKIRVFYLSSENTVKEIAYDKSEGWFEGSIGKKRYITAPYSSLAVCYLMKGSDMEMRVYCQLTDNTIQEFGIKDESWGWQKMSNLGPAMPGTEIACTAFKSPHVGIRVYFQHMEYGLIEKCHDGPRGWYDGWMKFPKMQPRTSIACTSYGSGSDIMGIHFFYTSADMVLEMVYDGKSWREGQFHADCIPGTEVACISWVSGSRPEIRIYLQAGHEVSAISEFAWTHGTWKSEERALPPA